MPGASLGLLLLRVTGPFEKLRKALHLWPGEPHTARLPPLQSVGPNRRLSFLVHFPSLCCGGGKAEAVMPLVSHFMQRGNTHRAGPRAQLTERDQAGTCPQRCPVVHGPVLPRRRGQGVGPEGVFKPKTDRFRMKASLPKRGSFSVVGKLWSEFCWLMGQNCLSD